MVELGFAGDPQTDDGTPRQRRGLAGIGKLRHVGGALKSGVEACKLGEQLFQDGNGWRAAQKP